MDMNELFDTPEKAEVALAQFRQLQTTEGWVLFKKIVQANIDVLKEQIINGLEGESPEAMDRKRDKLKAYEDIIGTPEMMIKKLTPSTPSHDENDPYDTVATRKEAKRSGKATR